MAADFQTSSFRAKTKLLLEALLLLNGLAAFVCLILHVGWDWEPSAQTTLHYTTRAVLWLFILYQAARLFFCDDFNAYLRHHWMELILTLFLLVEILLEKHFLAWFQGFSPALKPSSLTVFYLVLAQATLLAAIVLRLIRHSPKLSTLGLSPGLLLISSFGLAILTGTGLLLMPKATHEPITWLDALFTSTSAVCVTGLTVVDTATRFTLLGKIILLGLFQAGGLGIMTLTYFISHYFTGGVSVRDRILLQDFLNEENVGQITRTLVLILIVTFGVEFAGAVLLWASLPASFSPDHRAFSALFHSVSAFCNAGFSLYSENLAYPPIRSSVPFQTFISLLIILGGIGFPVFTNLWLWCKCHALRRLRRKPVALKRLNIHTRLVLVTTAFLVGAGALAFHACQYVWHDGPTFTPSAMTSFFNSVTARTAGFNTVPVESWSPAAVMVVLLLMFIGGSPGGTAGGIKTTTFAVGLMNLWRLLRDGAHLECFSRRISTEFATKAFAITLLAATWIACATVALAALHPGFPPLDVLFEVVSAFGTVGLTRGLTPLLSPPAKGIIILSMFVGRVSILLFVLAFLRRASPSPITLPEDRIIIG